MKKQQSSEDLFPNWLDDSIVRDFVIKGMNEKSGIIVKEIIDSNLNYLLTEGSFVEILLKHIPFSPQELTEDEFGYIIQLITAQCVVTDMIKSGRGKKLGENEFELDNVEKFVENKRKQ